MKLIQLGGGVHGTRQIADAWATVILRYVGEIPTIRYHNKETWTDEEYDEAVAMALQGVPRDQMAKRLGRTEKAINGMIGWERKVAVSY